jgi:Leucine-rich repeat (LRR) protein
MANEKELSFSGDEITEECLCALESNANLEQLVIWGGPLTNDRLAPLRRLTSLKGLVLGEMPIDDGVFGHLKPLRELTYLNLAYTNIRGNFTELADLPLRDVRLEGCRYVGDPCTKILATFPSLRQLEIHMTGLTDAGVHYLAHCPLETLWLGGRISDQGMNAVATLLALKHLDICSPGVTDEGVRAISGLVGLEVLWLSNCRITDVSVDVLSQFKSLRELAIGRTGISAAGRERLQVLLPQCRLVEEHAAGA